MLDRLTCKKCTNDYVGDPEWWDAYAELRWYQQEIVQCVCDKKGYHRGIEVKGLPPDNCPHLFEHAVASGLPPPKIIKD
jgi:hypothetical protein